MLSDLRENGILLEKKNVIPNSQHKTADST